MSEGHFKNKHGDSREKANRKNGAIKKSLEENWGVILGPASFLQVMEMNERMISGTIAQQQVKRGRRGMERGGEGGAAGAASKQESM